MSDCNTPDNTLLDAVDNLNQIRDEINFVSVAATRLWQGSTADGVYFLLSRIEENVRAISESLYALHERGGDPPT